MRRFCSSVSRRLRQEKPFEIRAARDHRRNCQRCAENQWPQIRNRHSPRVAARETRFVERSCRRQHLHLSERSIADRCVRASAERHRTQARSFHHRNCFSGVIRFDCPFHRARTHAIHVVTPLAARAASHASLSASAPASARQSASAGNPRLAIIIDDLGYDRSAADAVLALGFPLTVSVLPHLPLSGELAEEAQRRGDQVMLHLPMESEADGAKPEDIELRVGMSTSQVDATLAGMLETVPYAAGVNNHQGSRATADSALMQALMPALRQRGLFFVDSRTDAKTVAYDMAERAGVPAASRKVFLDDVASRDAILKQLNLAARDAQRDGFTIAIGHPRPATIAALAEGIPPLEARGIHLVFASELVH